jgi:hypothetical protein
MVGIRDAVHGTADRLFDIDGRIVARFGQLAVEHDVAVQDRAGGSAIGSCWSSPSVSTV